MEKHSNRQPLFFQSGAYIYPVHVYTCHKLSAKVWKKRRRQSVMLGALMMMMMTATKHGVAHSLDAAAALSRNASLGGPSRNHECDSLSIMPCWARGGGCGALSILSRWGGGL